MSLLDLRGVRIVYGQAVAVQGLDIHLDEGEFVSLIGHNGVGKSSTVKAISGLVKPASGTITFDGDEIQGKDPGVILRKGIAVVPEGRRIFTRLTVKENLTVGATVRKDRGGIEASYNRMIDRFPVLGKYAGRMAGLLSGGEQQQLAIARALMSEPKLLLLDEPSLGLAPQVVREIFAIIGRLRDQGLTILLVEQNANLALQMADRGYVLEAGRLTLSGPAAELLADERVRAAYLG